MDSNWWYALLVPFAGWLAKDYTEIRDQIKTHKNDIPHIRQRVDSLYDHLIGKNDNP